MILEVNVINEVLNYELFYKIKVIHVLGLIISLVVTHYLLKQVKRIVTIKLPLEDRNKFISIFQFLKYMIYVLVIMFSLHASGVNISVFLTASTALFVGVGFALQTFFLDIISGVLMIFDQSLHVGDIIEVESKIGEIREIRLRNTRMITRDNRVMIIPNHKFISEVLYNWTQNNDENRIGVSVGVAYGSDLDKVKQLLIESVRLSKDVLLTRDIIVLFEDFGDSSLNFSVYFYVKDAMRTPLIQSEIRFNINQLFEANRVIIPFPQRDVHIKREIQQ